MPIDFSFHPIAGVLKTLLQAAQKDPEVRRAITRMKAEI
jgi:hypothetical protein